jgi:hypothetical protein
MNRKSLSGKMLAMCVAIIVVVLSTAPVFASAEASAVVPVPTSEEKTVLAQKKAEMDAFLAKEQAMLDAGTLTLAAASTTVSLPIPAYQQANSYYCGPATVKAVVQYHNGTSSSQTTYANLLGTTASGTEFSKVATVLSDKTGKNYVYGQMATSMLQWKTCINLDLTTWEMAAIMDIRATSSNWKYPTTGHILPIRGMVYTGTVNSISHVIMADSHPDYCTANYKETATRAYNVNHAHPQQAMVF